VIHTPPPSAMTKTTTTMIIFLLAARCVILLAALYCSLCYTTRCFILLAVLFCSLCCSARCFILLAVLYCPLYRCRCFNLQCGLNSWSNFAACSCQACAAGKSTVGQVREGGGVTYLSWQFSNAVTSIVFRPPRPALVSLARTSARLSRPSSPHPGPPLLPPPTTSNTHAHTLTRIHLCGCAFVRCVFARVCVCERVNGLLAIVFQFWFDLHPATDCVLADFCDCIMLCFA
jgi:hypothetical protein